MHKLTIENLDTIRERVENTSVLKQDTKRVKITVHMGTCGIASGAQKIMDSLTEVIKTEKRHDIILTSSGCAGLCSREPMVTVEAFNQPPVKYIDVNDKKIEEIYSSHVTNGNVVGKYAIAYGNEKKPFSELRTNGQSGTSFDKEIELDQPEGKPVPKIMDIAFFKYQKLIALRNRAAIDPEAIDEYIARDGYRAVAKALKEMTPDQIIDEVKKAGVRGRGGGGFLTGMKWQLCAQAQGDVKYILCNGDEGDPGAFMDRSVLEGDPHSVLEGMIIAAKAIGARKGYIYIRAEYPLAIKRIKKAIEHATEYGLLGNDIFGTGFTMDIEIYQGAGAFVCGEETALMRSIEGKRGMPKPRPPYPANKGLFDRPSVLNNVETFVNIPLVILHGSDQFQKIGTEKSRGTKVFALSGCVNNIGLIEVPMGITLGTIINEIGGGIKGRKRKLKAVQVGGPSGGCIPAHLTDIPVDYESITKTGAIMGSGGMVVMDNKSCMVDVARFFLGFTTEESCGKCTPCREGNFKLLTKLNDICQGKGKEGDIEYLEELSSYIIDTSLCGLGKTSPNPVLTTIKYFRNEYEDHIIHKKCTAKRCAALLDFEVIPDVCTKCGRCYKACPAHAVSWEKKRVAVIDKEKCTKCLSCYSVCEFDAIS
jgi:NADH-quinone oxidoreductase subunit F/NAD(P)H dehydrogenase (quinone)/NADP-reducing hydrogenase subunit HndC